MPLNRRKYLLLDSRLINMTDNVTLRVGTVKKPPANPLFGEDMHWELRYDNVYPNAIYDEEERIFNREAIYGAQVVAAIEAQAFMESDMDKLLDIAVTQVYFGVAKGLTGIEAHG